MKRNSKKSKYLLPLLLGVSAVMALGVSSSGAASVAEAGRRFDKYYPSHLTMEDTLKAAADLNVELAAEGMVLLKNDGTLPLQRGAWVSVFGSHASGLNGGSTGAIEGAIETVPDALENAGFRVNPTLVDYYKSNGAGGSSGPMSAGGNYDNEPLTFSGLEKSSFRVYNDAAVIVLARTGGEGSDVSMNIGTSDEDIAKELEKDPDKLIYSEEASAEEIAAHVALPKIGDKYYRHALMLTESERQLIAMVKENFSKICVVINSSNAMELGELKDDDAINSMIWMGRPGETGAEALGLIISGEINPSGRLVDEFPRDFTADPTWCNFGNQNQVGNVNAAFNKDGSLQYAHDHVLGKVDDATYTSTDYEEDIYLGYRYYETYYEDLYEEDPDLATEWYNSHVAYAFGEGLSYTEFELNIEGVYTDPELETKLRDRVKAAEFESYEGHVADIEKLYVAVDVYNVGERAGKETVEIYVKAPYTPGGIEKSVHDIVGFGKTSVLESRTSETIVIEINVQDFASWDYMDANEDGVRGDYELDAGEYTIRATTSSHVDLNDVGQEYDEVNFKLDDNAHLKLDDFSHNPVHNLFTTEDGKYKGTADFDNKDIYNSVRTDDMMNDGKDPMTLMSRADFDGTFPKAVEKQKINGKEVNGLIFADEIYERWDATRTPRLDYGTKEAVDTSTDGVREYQQLTDNPNDPWYITQEEFDAAAANWTQAASGEGRTITVKYADLHGLPWDDPKYDEFLNQLTWDELVGLFTQTRASTPAISAVEKASSVDEDGPNNFENLFQWVDEPTIAATFNTDLAHREGEIVGDMALLNGRTGWYGPGMDMHHSPFSGRNNEYYSQDGLQGGYIAAAVVSGAQSKGLNAMVKHLAFNDQETNRGGQSNMVWTTEQNIRQYEIKMFQMAIQEGGAGAGMSGYGRICGIVNQSNYRLNHNLLQDEWGWKGFMITDGFLGMRWCTTIDIMMRAGFQIVYKTEPWYDLVSGTWDPSKRDGKGGVMVPTYDAGQKVDVLDDKTQEVVDWKMEYNKTGEVESYHQYYYARLNAKSVIYSTVNSNGYQNGFTGLAIKSGALKEGTAGLSYEDSVGISELVLGESTATYVADNLPEGLNLNSKTGKISGTPKNVGTFNFTVNITIDGYVKKTANYSITIASAFKWLAGSDQPDSLKVGEEFEATITSDIYTTKDEKYDSVEYSLSEGVLPAGLTLSPEGVISGTPTEAGVFPVTVKAVAVKANESSGDEGSKAFYLGGGDGSKGGTTETRDEATFSFTLVVAGDPAPAAKTVEEQIADLQAKLNDILTRLAALEKTGSADKAKIAEYEAEIARLNAEIARLKGDATDSSTSEQPKSGGCGGSIAAASIGLTLAFAAIAGLIAKKKKEE